MLQHPGRGPRAGGSCTGGEDRGPPAARCPVAAACQHGCCCCVQSVIACAEFCASSQRSNQVLLIRCGQQRMCGWHVVHCAGLHAEGSRPKNQDVPSAPARLNTCTRYRSAGIMLPAAGATAIMRHPASTSRCQDAGFLLGPRTGQHALGHMISLSHAADGAGCSA